MKEFLEIIKRVFKGKETPEVRLRIDKQNVSNMFILAMFVGLIQIFLFLVTLVFNYDLIESSPVPIYTTPVSVGICATVSLVMGLLQKKEKYPHIFVLFMTDAAFVAFVIWGMASSYSHIANGEQMITFFSVMICFLCFVAMRPVRSVPLIIAAYVAFYIVLAVNGQVSKVNINNYIMLALVSVTGTTVQYYITLRNVEKTVDLDAKNKDLSYYSRHDILTNMRNRAAFREDTPSYIGKAVTVVMTDIDRFKKFNDLYGHVKGDEVMQRIGEVVKYKFEHGHKYRYGGDEFLVIIEDDDTARAEELCAICSADTKRIRISGIKDTLGLSYGVASGYPSTESEFMAIISEADRKLYLMKKVVHSGEPDYGKR